MSKAAKTRTSEAATSTSTESVRDRILNTARDLFYRHGINSVGVDTVVAQSGVAKTSLYRWFPSKDALIAAVLEKEAEDRWAGWDYTAARSGTDPRERLRAQLAGIVKFVTGPKYRGCPFMNVTAEFADAQHPGRQVAREMMEELRRRVRALVEPLNVRDPQALTEQLVMLIDGAFSSAQIFGKEGPHLLLVATADALVDAQLAKGEGKKQ
jgi:AcrR family transcriptional regulator